MLSTITAIVGRQTNHPTKLITTSGTLDTLAELEVYANVTQAGSVLPADADDGPRFYVIYDDRHFNLTRGDTHHIILLTLGQWVSWTTKSPATEADLADGQTTGGADLT